MQTEVHFVYSLSLLSLHSIVLRHKRSLSLVAENRLTFIVLLLIFTEYCLCLQSVLYSILLLIDMVYNVMVCNCYTYLLRGT